MSVATPVSASIGATGSTRWIQLFLGLIAMMSISSPQYVWTLFTKPFQDNLHANLPAIQITFSVLIVLQTWLSPLQGWLVDKFGARLLIAIGCLLSGLGWVTSAYVDEPDRSVSHLWAVLRHRHRHRLYRHHRADGALVSRPARLCDRHGGGRLRLRRDRSPRFRSTPC